MYLFDQCISTVQVSCLQELKKHAVKDVVRVCDATYKTAPLELEGIRVLVGISSQSVGRYFIYISSAYNLL